MYSLIMVRKCFCKKSQRNQILIIQMKQNHYIVVLVNWKDWLILTIKNVFVRDQRQILTIQMKQKRYIVVLVN